MLTKLFLEGCTAVNVLALLLLLALVVMVLLWWRLRQYKKSGGSDFAAQATLLREQKAAMEQQVFMLENMLNLLRRRARNLLAYAPITLVNDATPTQRETSTNSGATPEKLHADTALLPDLAALINGAETNQETNHATVNLFAFSERVNKIMTALADNLAWYKSVISSLVLPTMVIDLDKTIKYVNQQFLDTRGKTFAEMHNKCCETFGFADCGSSDCCIDCFHHSIPAIPVYEPYCKKWLTSHVSALTDANNKHIGYILQLEDVTESYEIEKMMRKVFDAAPFATITATVENMKIKFLAVNHTAVEIFGGQSATDFINNAKNIFSEQPEYSYQALKERIADCLRLNTAENNLPWVWQKFNHEKLPLRLTLCPITVGEQPMCVIYMIGN